MLLFSSWCLWRVLQWGGKLFWNLDYDAGKPTCQLLLREVSPTPIFLGISGEDITEHQEQMTY